MLIIFNVKCWKLASYCSFPNLTVIFLVVVQLFDRFFMSWFVVDSSPVKTVSRGERWIRWKAVKTCNVLRCFSLALIGFSFADAMYIGVAFLPTLLFQRFWKSNCINSKLISIVNEQFFVKMSNLTLYLCLAYWNIQTDLSFLHSMKSCRSVCYVLCSLAIDADKWTLIQIKSG